MITALTIFLIEKAGPPTTEAGGFLTLCIFIIAAAEDIAIIYRLYK